MRAIQVAMSNFGARVFRNNVGLFTTNRGTKVRTGLCAGSSDLIGWTATGVFLAIEVKSDDGDAKPEQLEFIETVKRHGGVAFIARSVKEAEEKYRQSVIGMGV